MHISFKFLLYSLLGIFFLAPVYAQNTAVDNDAPIHFSAINFDFDSKRKIYNASGEVELKQSGRTLKADKIIYDLKKDQIIAQGNVYLESADGHTIQSNSLDLRDHYSNGELQQVKIRFDEHIRLDATKVTRRDLHENILHDASFTPCPKCHEDSTPLWSLSANKIIYDTLNEDIIYHHAVLNVKGVPLFYLPYFMHPSPRVEKRSGLLMPRFTQSNQRGTIFQLPYYYAMGDQSDVVLTPHILAEGGGIIQADIRHRFAKGFIEADISGGTFSQSYVDAGNTSATEQGHIFLESFYEHDANWMSGLDYQRTSNRVYMREFGLGARDILTSRLYTQYLSDTAEFTIEGYLFQGLRATDNNSQIADLLPHISYQWRHHDEQWGNIQVEADYRYLTRDIGNDVQRLTGLVEWGRPFYSDTGFVLTPGAAWQGDLTWSRSHTNSYWEEDHRGHAQASFDVSYPLIQYFPNGISWSIAPKAVFYAAEQDNDAATRINEDSLGFFFDYDSLFQFNRFSGYDLVTSGNRVDYGITSTVQGNGHLWDIFVGQSYRDESDAAFGAASGLDQEYSDYLAKMRYQSESMSVYYLGQFDSRDVTSKRQEASFQYAFGEQLLGLDYAYAIGVNDNSLTTTNTREQVQLRSQFSLTDRWLINFNGIKSLAEADSGTRQAGIGFSYKHPCLRIDFGGLRRYTQDRELEQEDMLYLRVTLDQLGSLGQ